MTRSCGPRVPNAKAQIYEKFGRIFARLPLASVIDNQAGAIDHQDSG